MNNQRLFLTEKINIILFSIMIASFFIFNMIGSFSSLSIVAFSGVMFLVYALSHNCKIHIPFNYFHLYILCFAVFCIMSSAWAEDGRASRTMGITIIELLICMSVVFICFQDLPSVEYLLKAIMWSGVIIGIYTIYYYGISKFMGMLTGTLRIGNDYSNANAVGMWGAICAVLFLFFILQKWSWKYIAVIIPICLVAMSQSRTALIQLLIGSFLIIYFRYRYSTSFFKGLFKIAIALLVFVFVVYSISKLEIFEGINERMNSLFAFMSGESVREGSVVQRQLYIKAGWKVFIKHPLFGIGIANSHIITSGVTGHSTYLHNNFVELLACGGIIGFFLYYGLTIHMMTRLWKFSKQGISSSDICFVILLLKTIADYGTVSYYSKQGYVILLVCCLQLFHQKYSDTGGRYINEKNDDSC